MISAIVAGVLLALSYPKFNFGFFGWVALIPSVFATVTAPTRFLAVLRGLVTGLIFFGISLHWLTHVATIGWIFVACLQALFFVLFVLLIFEGRHIHNPFLNSLWIAGAWTFIEVLRSEIAIFGFGWNLLAYSQSDYLWIRLGANTIGAYGLGFVMCLTNALIFHFLENVYLPLHWSSRKKKLERIHAAILLGMTLVLMGTAVISHGYHHAKQSIPTNASLKLGVVQGNIPQSLKWEPEARDKIIEKYLKLTELVSFKRPGLVIWPEAAFPGYLNRDIDAQLATDLVKKLKLYLLAGSPHFEEPNDAYNSAYLINQDGEIKQRYDKQFLVPFGEYVPLKLVFGWLESIAYAMGVSDFRAGKDFTIFDIFNGEILFSTLICFEDTFEMLARTFVEKGAQFLVVMTNDAWFGNTGAPYQHLQASIFRAIETGVPVIRAANTGVSCVISPFGKILERVQNETGKDLFITGNFVYEISFNTHQPKTYYLLGGWKFGYAVAYVFATIALIHFLFLARKRI